MNYIFSAIIILCPILRSLCQQCPAIYLRYSKDHSYCKPRSNTCPMYHSGVSLAQRRQIVNLHNEYRSFVATGKEKQAGGLPEASDMLQMVWDKELEAVAQKTAEQCIYQHDCSNCRRVENFEVGQNIAYLSRQCTRGECPLNPVPDWNYVIKMFYDEVAIFDKEYVRSMQFRPGKEYGHFTQMVWSRTWRIGCGFVAFKNGNGYKQLFFCNYGPSGNILGMPMYEIGSPCSVCPINSCCGSSCRRPNYDGLCRMNRNNEAPIYRPEENYIFYCDFRNVIGDCSTSIDGTNKWKYITALGGSFVEIVLKSGESSTIKFVKTIRPKHNFCLIVKYRTGSAVDGQKQSNTAVVHLEMPNAIPQTLTLPKAQNKEFFVYSISLNWSLDTKVSFTLSVPNGDPAQYFNIQFVAAKIGGC